MNINIRKKNEDGSYDNGEYLFNAVDLYDGCSVNRILEISPATSKSEKNIKFSMRTVIGDNEYNFLPDKHNKYNLVDMNHPGLSFFLTDKNKIKYLPDKNGIISITNVLSGPMELILHMEAKKYTITDLNKNIVMDDMNIIIWSSASE